MPRLAASSTSGLLWLAVLLGTPCIVPFTALRAATDETSVASAIGAEVHQIFDERKDAVVRVRARDGLGFRVGSGFFVDPAGTVFTHAGIVSNADEVTVVAGGRELPAKVLTADQRSGIAILKVEAITPFLPMADHSSVTVATPLIVIGFPEDLDVCPSFGIVAGFDRKYQDQYLATTHIRANLPVQWGQAGAPVLDMKGSVVGVLMGRIEGGAACHILPIRAAEKVRMDMVRFGEVRPGWVGVEVEDTAIATGGSTARVEKVDEGTPAAAAGVRRGDVILGIGATAVTASEDVLDASFFLTAGDAADIQILRDGQRLSIPVKPAIHPASERGVQSAGAAVSPQMRLE